MDAPAACRCIPYDLSDLFLLLGEGLMSSVDVLPEVRKRCRYAEHDRSNDSEYLPLIRIRIFLEEDMKVESCYVKKAAEKMLQVFQHIPEAPGRKGEFTITGVEKFLYSDGGRWRSESHARAKMRQEIGTVGDDERSGSPNRVCIEMQSISRKVRNDA